MALKKWPRRSLDFTISIAVDRGASLTNLATPPVTLQTSLVRKKDQRLDFVQWLARVSRSKSSPIGIPHPESKTSWSVQSSWVSTSIISIHLVRENARHRPTFKTWLVSGNCGEVIPDPFKDRFALLNSGEVWGYDRRELFDCDLRQFTKSISVSCSKVRISKTGMEQSEVTLLPDRMNKISPNRTSVPWYLSTACICSRGITPVSKGLYVMLCARRHEWKSSKIPRPIMPLLAQASQCQ